ncbi:MAG TPA: hypothetical protein VN578_16560 [Candidatus Binatia bacterium]|nr:hypothetical protein [Candidatus Binatia bacterium]
MENHPLSFESVLEWLQKQAATSQTLLIVQARFAISPRETRLLAIQPEASLETIHY